jgi:predicted metal-binding membrane protein
VTISRLWCLPASAWTVVLAAPLVGLQLHDHHAIFEGAHSATTAVLAVLVFLVGWQFMVVAMMVPSTIDAIAPTESRPPCTGHIAPSRFLLGYLTVWAALGACLLAADGSLHGTVDAIPAIAHRPWVVSAAILLLAGAWQLTPARTRCLQACRAELGEVARATGDGRASFRLGLTHGVSCAGSCGLVMVAVMTLGSGLPATIGLVATAVLVFVEKTGRRGEQLAVAAGLVLLGAGATAIGLHVG